MSTTVITHEERKRFAAEFYNPIHGGDFHKSLDAALADFLDNNARATPLRPIAEAHMPVPAGAFRLYGTIYQDGVIGKFITKAQSGDSHFIDTFKAEPSVGLEVELGKILPMTSPMPKLQAGRMRTYYRVWRKTYVPCVKSAAEFFSDSTLP